MTLIISDAARGGEEGLGGRISPLKKILIKKFIAENL